MRDVATAVLRREVVSPSLSRNRWSSYPSRERGRSPIRRWKVANLSLQLIATVIRMIIRDKMEVYSTPL